MEMHTKSHRMELSRNGYTPALKLRNSLTTSMFAAPVVIISCVCALLFVIIVVWLIVYCVIKWRARTGYYSVSVTCNVGTQTSVKR